MELIRVFHITSCSYTVIYGRLFYAIKGYLHFFSVYLLLAFTCHSCYTNVPPATTNILVFDFGLKISRVVAHRHRAWCTRDRTLPREMLTMVCRLAAHLPTHLVLGEKQLSDKEVYLERLGNVF